MSSQNYTSSQQCESLEGVQKDKKIKVSWEIFFGFRNALNATMDAENLALAQEEATLTKIRTLLNQHKVGESLKTSYMVGAGEAVGAPLL